ncbi:MAG TPA: response regulator [Rhizomicrobium sp.]|nr:response regulator [Rhizomicrobium sp.]
MPHNALNVSSISKPQILICDDDVEFSSELIEALQARGFAATALLTLSAIRAAILSPSILLLDVCMPEPDGIEILKMLGAHERKHHFKIAMVSGSDESILASAAKICEAEGLYLLGSFHKPVNIRELCELLEDAGVY